MLKCVQAIAGGLDATFSNFGLGGMASVFQLMEVAHTHYWSKEINEGSDMSSSLLSSHAASPMGSRENLRSPSSPNGSHSGLGSEWASPQESRKSSTHTALSATTAATATTTAAARRLSSADSQDGQSTTEMFKDMLSQKRSALKNMLTSFDSDVSVAIVKAYSIKYSLAQSFNHSCHAHAHANAHAHVHVHVHVHLCRSQCINAVNHRMPISCIAIVIVIVIVIVVYISYISIYI